MTTATQTIREIAQTQPSSIRVFERFGIEYCCGGRKLLADACAAKEIEVDKVIAALEVASHTESPETKDWAKEPLANLIAHIVATHHAYCKGELGRLSGLAAKVFHRHGGTNPELGAIQSKLAQLADELTDHLAEEEVVVFPMIVELAEESARNGLQPNGRRTSIGKPLAQLADEHDHAGILLAEIRNLSREFTSPDYACSTYRAFLEGLREFERDLHRHIHLENNILFPRAIEREAFRG